MGSTRTGCSPSSTLRGGPAPSHDLLDFAGRSFPAWHHHMTMASAAYTYTRLAHVAHPMEPPLAGRRSA
ncbi:hypothetical protein PWE32_09610 [Streptomyces neyagawaensis]|nr:hypothetical protein [Streptomyces neyagawaensis]MCL6731937.1 hypothetical protein [Streptomyces neyagawaensis]MDE1682569.1 hypothetical protein [Streptomyces neyagawaensis]